MTSKTRVGIIGCGRIAVTHAAALTKIENAELAACCDIDLERANTFAAEHGVPRVFFDAHALLQSDVIDVALVCTPHPAHEAVVVAAAQAGVHVLCEKPISTSLAEADRMIAAADAAGIKFGVIFQRRFWPSSQRIRAAIDGGKLGNLTLGECIVRIWRPEEYYALDPWRGKWATEGGGVLMNQAIHSVDHFQWFMGDAVEVVGRYATLRHGRYIDVEDTALAVVTFANGAIGMIEATSTVQPNAGFRVSVHGDAGATVSSWENPEGVVGVNDVWTIPGEEALRDEWAAQDAGQPGFPLYHELQIRDFIDAVQNDRAPAVTGKDARKSLEIILAIYESSRTGLPIKLPMQSN